MSVTSRIHDLLLASDDDLEGAMWWVQRWVTGSMNDPDWAEGEAATPLSLVQAFELIQKVVGNKLSVRKTLWRAVTVARPKAFQAASVLKPNRQPFQSFTTSRNLAVSIGRDLQHGQGTPMIVSAKVPARDVMFGIDDLRACRVKAVRSNLSSLRDWYGQHEVVVRVAKPLSLLTVEVDK